MFWNCWDLFRINAWYWFLWEKDWVFRFDLWKLSCFSDTPGWICTGVSSFCFLVLALWWAPYVQRDGYGCTFLNLAGQSASNEWREKDFVGSHIFKKREHEHNRKNVTLKVTASSTAHTTSDYVSMLRAAVRCVAWYTPNSIQEQDLHDWLLTHALIRFPSLNSRRSI